MMLIRFITSFIVFFITTLIFGQNPDYNKDSIAVITFTKNLDEYYKDPKFFMDSIENYHTKLKLLINKNPNNSFLKYQEAAVLDYKAYFNRRELNFETSLKMLEKSASIQKELSNIFMLPRTYRGLARIWRYQNDKEKEKKYLLLAKEIAEKKNNSAEIIRAKSGLLLVAIDAIQSQKKPKAIDSIYRLSKKSFIALGKEAEQLGLNSLAANEYFHVARIMRLLKESPKEIELYLQKSSELYTLDQNLLGQEKSMYSLATFYRKNNKANAAVPILLECIKIRETLNDSIALKNRYLALSNTARSLTKYELAYNSYTKYKRISERITNKENYINLANLEYIHKVATDSIKMEQKKLLLKQKLESDASQRILFISSAFLIALALIFILYLNNRKKKLEVEKLALEKERQNFILTKEVTKKESQLTGLLNENIKHINDKQLIKENLKKIEYQQDSVTIKSILTDIKLSEIEDEKRTLYRNKILANDSDFVKRLATKFPKLTETDIEICCYERAGLTRKEMATLRGTSLEAIKSNRYRLKKKLGLNREHSIRAFLTSL